MAQALVPTRRCRGASSGVKKECFFQAGDGKNALLVF
jgi:hypothetical protein